MTSNYFVAENGVTRRSRRFSVFIGCLRDDRLGNNGNIYIVHEVEENLHFLLALAAGFVRGIYIDRLDKLSEGIGGQFREGAVPLYPLNELLYILCLLFLFMNLLLQTCLLYTSPSPRD